MVGIVGHSNIVRHWVRVSSGLARLSGSVAFAVLASCSGSSGGGGGGNSNLASNPDAAYLDAVAEPSAPAVAGDWSGSQEYLNSTGLGQVKAAEGYARRIGGLPGGQGVRIAIIDSGIDVAHPDLGNLADTSWIAGNEELVGDSHATFVAGIAGASRTQSSNPNDIHGLAYRATLVNFQAARPSQTQANGFVSFSTDDLVDAMRAASGLTVGETAVESDIFNLSLGAVASSDSIFARLQDAMRGAANAGKIMVLAAGNEGGSGTPGDRLQPIYPAAYADDAGIAGYAIVVGNLTSTDQAAASSNFCGDAQDYCLFAPGTSIRSTLNDGAYGIGTGTSFAAPYVAGAAAVVKAAFPGVSSRDVVDRLLLTAADLGDVGVDSTFGRGRLDLEAAMAPVGPTALPTGTVVDGPSIALEASTLQLGPGLRLGQASAERLERVMAVDSMGFPFPVDLGDAISTTKRDHGLAAFIGDDSRSLAAAGAGSAAVRAFVDAGRLDDSFPQQSATSLRRHAEEGETVPLHFSADVAERLHVFAALNQGAVSQLGLDSGLAERRAMFMQSSQFFSPFDGLASGSSGAGIGFNAADGTEISVAAFTSLAEQSGAKNALQRFEVRQRVPGSIDLRFGLGLVQEDGTFIGGEADGAFGEGGSARSQFMTLSLLGPITEDIDWFATYSRGQSSIGEADDALLSNWSDTKGEAFGAGLVIRDLARDDDGLTLLVGQPFRQKQAEATIDLPVARKPDGTVVTRREKLDFAPRAREITAEIGYRLPFGEGGEHDLRAAGFLRLNPDHDPNRDPDTGFGVAYRWTF